MEKFYHWSFYWESFSPNSKILIFLYKAKQIILYYKINKKAYAIVNPQHSFEINNRKHYYGTKKIVYAVYIHYYGMYTADDTVSKTITMVDEFC